MQFDFVSLVPAGDDPLAQVVIAKVDPSLVTNDSTTPIQEENNMEKISKDGLDPEVVEYIEGLEGEVDTLSKQVETSEAEVATITADRDGLKDQVSKMVPANDEAAEAISKAALEAMDPGTRSIIAKMQADADTNAKIAKEERDLRLEREFISKAEALPMVGEDKVALGGLLRRLSEALAPEDAAEVEKILKAANTHIAKGNLFGEMGTGGGEVTISKSVEAAAEAIKKSDSSLTDEQAIAKAYADNPALLAEAMSTNGQEG